MAAAGFVCAHVFSVRECATVRMFVYYSLCLWVRPGIIFDLLNIFYRLVDTDDLHTRWAFSRFSVLFSACKMGNIIVCLFFFHHTVNLFFLYREHAVDWSRHIRCLSLCGRSLRFGSECGSTHLSGRYRGKILWDQEVIREERENIQNMRDEMRAYLSYLVLIVN